MKRILIALLALITISSHAQDFSIINFIAYGGFSEATIYVDNQKVGILKKDECFQYKVYSEGTKSVRITADHSADVKSLSISHGHTYYYEVGFGNFNCEIVSEKRG